MMPGNWTGKRAVSASAMLEHWRAANARRVACPKRGCGMTTGDLARHNEIHHS